MTSSVSCNGNVMVDEWWTSLENPFHQPPVSSWSLSVRWPQWSTDAGDWHPHGLWSWRHHHKHWHWYSSYSPEAKHSLGRIMEILRLWFRRKWTDLDEIGYLWARCWGLALAYFGRDPRSSDSLRGSRNFIFMSGK